MAEIDPKDYLLKDGYILFVPSFDLESDPRRVLLYDVVEILELRHADERLTGHPDVDLPEWAWGGIDFPAHRVRRWVEKNRLVKAKPKKSMTGWRVTYCEPSEWQQVLSEEEWAWIISVCQVSHLYAEELVQQAEVKQVQEPVPKKTKNRGKHLKAKDRRRAQRRMLEGDRREKKRTRTDRGRDRDGVPAKDFDYAG